jgi:hypothetical protein
MITIGLGNAGIHICRKLSNLGKHKTIELHGGKGLPECQTHEEYEASVPKLGNKLRLGKDQDIWLIVCGAARVSGATLAILEQIKDREVKVMYIVPDPFFMSATQKKQHRVVYNVLQEYARSGMIHSLVLVSNKETTIIVGEGSLGSYYDNVNSAIANFLANYNWFKNSDPIMGNLHEPKEISRICTVSIGEIEENQEKLYFLLDNITESCYYYSISSEDKENDNKLLSRIRSYLETKEQTTFGIWENASDRSFFYSIKFTHYIQE